VSWQKNFWNMANPKEGGWSATGCPLLCCVKNDRRQPDCSAPRLASLACGYQRNINSDATYRLCRSTYQPVLPVVPRVRAAAVTHDAPTSCGRAQPVRRLLRQMRADCRSADRRSADGGDLPGCARHLQLHLRRGNMDADVAGLDRGDKPAPSRTRLLPNVHSGLSSFHAFVDE
jgi:hypothetical protein